LAHEKLRGLAFGWKCKHFHFLRFLVLFLSTLALLRLNQGEFKLTLLLEYALSDLLQGVHNSGLFAAATLEAFFFGAVCTFLLTIIEIEHAVVILF
jgi:hypothetical protein